VDTVDDESTGNAIVDERGAYLVVEKIRL